MPLNAHTKAPIGPPNSVKTDERTGKILRILVEGHIQSTAPVSSLYITQQPQINLSSATIRSILASLEAQGYLFSPYRSAGRLPTEKAYRYYVDHLVPLPRENIRKEERYIQKECLKKNLANLAIEDILETIAKILSIITSYASLILGPPFSRLVLKHIELIDMGENEVLVIFVTRSGKVLSCKIFIEERIPGNILRAVSNRLNQSFQGAELNEMHSGLCEERECSDEHYYSLLVRALEKNFSALTKERGAYEEGFNQLDSCVSKESLGSLRKIIEEGKLDRVLPPDWDRKKGIAVTIAGESDKRLAGISIVSGSYQMGEKPIGTVNVIGPNHMPYDRVVTLVEYVRRLISNMVTRLSN